MSPQVPMPPPLSGSFYVLLRDDQFSQFVSKSSIILIHMGAYWQLNSYSRHKLLSVWRSLNLQTSITYGGYGNAILNQSSICLRFHQQIRTVVVFNHPIMFYLLMRTSSLHGKRAKQCPKIVSRSSNEELTTPQQGGTSCILPLPSISSYLCSDTCVPLYCVPAQLRLLTLFPAMGLKQFKSDVERHSWR